MGALIIVMNILVDPVLRLARTRALRNPAHEVLPRRILPRTAMGPLAPQAGGAFWARRGARAGRWACWA